MLKTLYRMLEKPYLTKYGYFIQNIILFNILLNLLSFSIPLFFNLNDKTLEVFNTIQNITVYIFIVELLLRYIAIGENEKYRGILGKLKYTFKFYTLIDIVAIIPFFLTFINIDFAYIRALRFLRLFKLVRMKKIMKKFFSLRSFAMSKMTTQIFVLFMLSGMLIFVFSYVYNSADKSFLIFVDPPGVIEAKGFFHRAFAVLEWILGMFLGGALISIITSSLIDISEDVQKGYLSFKEKNHIVIIGSNKTLDFIFKGINQFYLDHERQQDVVLFLPYIENINLFRENLKEYSNLDVTIITGDPFTWNSYDRANINFAKKVLILNDENSYEKNHNIELTRYILVHKNFDNSKLEFIIQTRFQTDMQNIKSIYEYMFESVPNKHLLVNNDDIIKRFLNRSIVNNDYFKVFLKLLSFESSEFYILENKKVFKNDVSFKEACLNFKGGIIVGIVQDGNIKLNPPNETIISKEDKIVAILKNSLSYFTTNNKYQSDNIIALPQPKLTVDKNICIVGNHSDIKINDISQFISQKSIDNYIQVTKKDGNYIDKDIWEEVRKKNTDMIILNLEDKHEFIVTMYLKNRYKHDKEFLSKIINIINDPVTAKLLSGQDKVHNIILSEKIIGQYISLIMFNSFAVEIFDEVTDKKGNEFYILDKKEYEEIFSLEFDALEETLIENNMIYMGAFEDNEFKFNSKNIENTDKILVLTEGV